VIASGLLCGALALVVIYTSKRAFFSPAAVVIVAAIGVAAVLLQLRFRHQPVNRSLFWPLGLNVMGIVLALIALFADSFHLRPQVAESVALAAIGTFAIGSAWILHGFRKPQDSREP
jgi:uncharacterized membrane protein